MRTTTDLTADLMQAARVRAALRGESLKELFTRAIAHEVRGPGQGCRAARASFPLIGRDGERRSLRQAVRRWRHSTRS